MQREYASFIALRSYGLLVSELEPFSRATGLGATHVVSIGLRRPKSVPTLPFSQIAQERSTRRVFKRFGRSRAADEMHDVE
jgi:hypothetical protein